VRLRGKLRRERALARAALARCQRDDVHDGHSLCRGCCRDADADLVNKRLITFASLTLRQRRPFRRETKVAIKRSLRDDGQYSGTGVMLRTASLRVALIAGAFFVSSAAQAAVLVTIDKSPSR
jgi:hypothetical protein